MTTTPPDPGTDPERLRIAESGRASLGAGVWITGNIVVYRDEFNRAAERWVAFRPPWKLYEGRIGLIKWIHSAIESDGDSVRAGYRTLNAAFGAIEDRRNTNG